MPSSTITLFSSLGGVGINASITRAGNGVMYHEIPLAAGTAATITWGAATAVLEFAAAHGITSGNRLGIFWGTTLSRVGLTAITVSATQLGVTNSAGTGTALPTSSTASGVLGNSVSAPDVNFDGDSLVLWMAACDQKAAVEFQEAGGANVGLAVVNTPNDGSFWASGMGIAAPVAGSMCVNAQGYNGSTVACTFKFNGLLNT